MKFSDFQKELLDVSQLADLKGGAQAPAIGCQSGVCDSAMESIADGLCSTAVCSSRAA